MQRSTQLRAVFVCMLALMGACEGAPTLSLVEPTQITQEPLSLVAHLECRVDLTTVDVRCSPVQPQAAARFAIIGGQGVNLRLRSTNVAYDATLEDLRADITVENLMSQPMGTPDGFHVTGVNAFHATGPTITEYYVPGDTGTAFVANPDGYGNFTGENQPYFEYPEILATHDTSTAKTWHWHIPPSVKTFSFTLLVEAAMPSETGLPMIPWSEFSFPDDTLAYPITEENPDVRYYRTAIGVVFDDTATAQTFIRILDDYGAELIDGTPSRSGYVLGVPDPGPGLNDLNALLDNLGAEPGVHFAFPLAYFRRVELDLRYPDDSPGMRRTNWINASGTETWALRAIRAPLAWGCETGLYGSPERVTVGVLDYLFDSTNPDFDSSNVSLIQPDTGLKANPDLSLVNFYHHGTAVSGAITALGDNGRGVAGGVWGSNIHMFSLAKGNRSVRDPINYLVEYVLPEARKRGVRVFVAAVEFQSASRQEYDRVENALSAFVDGTDALFIRSVGNSHVTATAAEVGDTALFGTAGPVVARAVTRLITTGGRAGHFLTVAGSEQASSGVRRWKESDESGSNFITGATQIVAPAKMVRILLNRSAGAGDVSDAQGTSIAAPIVGGVAAQLWAMDPTLTAAEVKDYILRGAQRPRRDPGTGQMVNPGAVSGFPETVYQVDAYGSVTLLSRERDGTPVCGFPVRADGSHIVLERRPGGFTQLSAAGSNPYVGVSVSQGGRKIAYTDDGAGVVRIINHVGQLLGTVTGPYRRQYLERDTVDFTFVSDADATGPRITIRRSDGTVQGPLNLFQQAVPHALERLGLYLASVEVSPTGEWAFVGGLYTVSSACGSGTMVARGHLVRLRGGSTVHTVYEASLDACRLGTDPCVNCATLGTESATWLFGGDTAVVALPYYDISQGGAITGLRTALITATTSGATSSTTREGWEVYRPQQLPDDLALSTYENDGGNFAPATACNLVTRLSRSLTTIISAASADQESCSFQVPPNVPQNNRVPAFRVSPSQIPRPE